MEWIPCNHSQCGPHVPNSMEIKKVEAKLQEVEEIIKEHHAQPLLATWTSLVSKSSMYLANFDLKKSCRDLEDELEDVKKALAQAKKLSASPPGHTDAEFNKLMYDKQLCEANHSRGNYCCFCMMQALTAKCGQSALHASVRSYMSVPINGRLSWLCHPLPLRRWEAVFFGLR